MHFLPLKTSKSDIFCVDKFYLVCVIFVIKNRLFLWSCPKEKLSCYCMRVFFTKISLAPVQNPMNYWLVSKECNIVICKRFANCFVLNGLFQAVNWRIFSLKINRATQNHVLLCYIVSWLYWKWNLNENHVKLTHETDAHVLSFHFGHHLLCFFLVVNVKHES